MQTYKNELSTSNTLPENQRKELLEEVTSEQNYYIAVYHFLGLFGILTYFIYAIIVDVHGYTSFVIVHIVTCALLAISGLVMLKWYPANFKYMLVASLLLGFTYFGIIEVPEITDSLVNVDVLNHFTARCNANQALFLQQGFVIAIAIPELTVVVLSSIMVLSGLFSMFESSYGFQRMPEMVEIGFFCGIAFTVFVVQGLMKVQVQYNTRIGLKIQQNNQADRESTAEQFMKLIHNVQEGIMGFYNTK